MRELRNIEIFAEVANCQSFSRAAKNLFLTPSAVSMSIQKLEGALGARLLTRTTRQLSLTADGQFFLEHAEEGLKKIYEGIDLFCNRKRPLSGLLRISVPSSIGRHYIMPALPEFMKRYPEISLEVSFDDHLPDLIKDKLDLGLCWGETACSSYVGRLLCTPPMTLVASPDYLAECGTPTDIADLEGHRIINIQMKDTSATWTVTERLSLATAAHEPKVVEPKAKLNIIESHDSAIDAALHDMGIALVLRKLADPYLKSGELRSLLPKYEVSPTDRGRVSLLYPTKNFIPARLRVFIDYLVEISAREEWTEGAVNMHPCQEGTREDVPTLAATG